MCSRILYRFLLGFLLTFAYGDFLTLPKKVDFGVAIVKKVVLCGETPKIAQKWGDFPPNPKNLGGDPPPKKIFPPHSGGGKENLGAQPEQSSTSESILRVI